MGKESNSYRNILRAASLFGSAHIFQVVLALLRGKVTAAILGPAGMGVYSLFQSASATLQKGSSLGLDTGIVKETAATIDKPAVHSHIQTVALRMTVAAAIAGFLICILCSRWLSLSTFGNYAFTRDFMLLGVCVGFSVAASGKLAILQAAGEVKAITGASLATGVIGLCASVPIYLCLHTAGIVPALTVFSAASFCALSIAARWEKISITTPFSWKDDFPIMKSLLSLGGVFMATELLTTLVSYGINVFLRIESGDETVGLFQAANSVSMQYVGAVLSVLAMDYFPRLSRVAACNVEMNRMVNRQMEIVAVVMAPAAVLLVLTAPWAIRVFLSVDYLSVTPLMKWMAAGIFLKALMTPPGYIIFAKGDRKLFFWTEGIACNLLTFILSYSFFRIWGLMGLGYAMVVDNAICLTLYMVINKRLYGFRPNKNTVYYGLTSASLTAAALACSFLPQGASTAACILLLAVSLSGAWLHLRKRWKSGL